MLKQVLLRLVNLGAMMKKKKISFRLSVLTGLLTKFQRFPKLF